MIRLLLVDDQELVCQGLKAMLSLESDLKIVGIANNGQDAIEQVKILKPDIVLMDIRMPVIDGREATRIICRRFPDSKVLVLSTFDENKYIAQSIQAGARGYLLKNMPCEELVQAIRLVYRGYSQMGPGLMEKMVNGILDSDAVKAEPIELELAQLTHRELDVLNLICQGSTNREIAQQLYITEGTVKTHLTHIFNRLNLRNRSQLAIYAISAKQNF